MKFFDFSFLKEIERKVIVITASLFVAIFVGSIIGDYFRGYVINYNYALINAFFISLSIGVVMVVTKTRAKDKEKKNYREIKQKKKRRK